MNAAFWFKRHSRSQGNTCFLNMKCAQTSASRCAFAALPCLLPHSYVLQGGPCACRGCQPVGAGPSFFSARGLQASGIKCWAASTDRWSLVGLPQWRFSRLPVFHYLRKCTTQLDTTYTCNEMWHPQRCLQCLRVWSLISSTPHSIHETKSTDLTTVACLGDHFKVLYIKIFKINSRMVLTMVLL